MRALALKSSRKFKRRAVMTSQRPSSVLLVIAALVIWASANYAGRRNEMVHKREEVNAACSQVDVVLQRRADLIRNLVETVKGFAAQEQTVLRDIANTRRRASRRLFVVENYPQSKWKVFSPTCLPLA